MTPSMTTIPTTEAAGAILCHDITRIVPGESKGPAFRKGHVVTPEDIPELLKLGKDHLYVWQQQPGILHENDAAARLARAATGKNLRDGVYSQDSTAEALALTTLVYQIISRPEGCLRTRILSSTDPEKELMERQLRDYIFSDITLEQFAERTNRSLSSFKKKFKEYYNEPPHRWVIRQRLMYARLQVISTDRDISLISMECRFQNPSYFIRLFRKEFGLTPAQYRTKYGNSPAKYKMADTEPI